MVAFDRYEIRQDARRFENWESSIAGTLGMGAAVEYARSLGLDAIWQRVRRQADHLRHLLATLRGVTLHDLGSVKGGIVTFAVDSVPAGTVVERLKAQSINTTVSSVASTRYDMEARGLRELVRASVHYITTDEECTRLIDAISMLKRRA